MSIDTRQDTTAHAWAIENDDALYGTVDIDFGDLDMVTSAELGTIVIGNLKPTISSQDVDRWIDIYADRQGTGSQFIVTRLAGEHVETNSALVQRIKELSGLTWDELGKVFGVSRRAVHQWASGGRQNAFNSRRVHRIHEIVLAIDKGDAEITREAFLTAQHGQDSIYADLVGEVTTQERADALAPSELIAFPDDS